MRRVLVTSGIILTAVLAAGTAFATHCLEQTCTSGTYFWSSVTTDPCDVTCDTASCTFNHTLAQCDVCGANNPEREGPDGKCVICNHDGHGAVTIVGDSISEIICGGDGDDVLEGKNGNDIIMGGGGSDTILGGNGADDIVGGTGYDFLYGDADTDDIVDVDTVGTFVDGGSHDDRVWTGSGDDTIFGGTGNDLVIGQGGGDYIDGGAGNDSLSSIVYGQPSIQDDIIGERICGGDGNDAIYARGPRHQCADGGDGYDICLYDYYVTTRTAGSGDVGTTINCESEYGSISSRNPDCACP